MTISTQLAEFEAKIDSLASLPYKARRRELWHWVSPRVSRFLYKFRAVCPTEELSVDRLRDVIVRSRLWLSSPADFNDPFDMAVKVTADGTRAEIRRRLDALLEAKGMPWTQRRKELPRIIKRTKQNLSSILQEAHHRQVNGAGVYSFAGDPRSIHMWSHYASNHTGCCLQFEVAKDLRTFAHALPVEYNVEYPVVNWVTDFDAGVQSSILRKYRHWKYEKESRITRLDGPHRYLPFVPEALTGIILGCRANDATVTCLSTLLAERALRGFPAPRLYRATKHDAQYRLAIRNADLGTMTTSEAEQEARAGGHELP